MQGYEINHRGGIIRQQYADWLKSYWWDDMLTVTFRSARHEPYYSLVHVKNELLKYYAGRGFLVCEPHQSGELHIHGIIAGHAPGFKPELSLPWDIWNGLFHRFGRSKVSACNSIEAVSEYCSKYILKQQSRVCDYYYIFGSSLDWRSGKLDNNDIQN